MLLLTHKKGQAKEVKELGMDEAECEGLWIKVQKYYVQL